MVTWPVLRSFRTWFVIQFCANFYYYLAWSRSSWKPRWSVGRFNYQRHLQLEVSKESTSSVGTASVCCFWTVSDRLLALHWQLGADFWIPVWHVDGCRWAFCAVQQFIWFLALLPYFEFGQYTRFAIFSFSLTITGLMFVFLLVLFYGFPVIDVPLLTMLNCPFSSSKVCHQQGLILRSWLPIWIHVPNHINISPCFNQENN